MFQDAKNKLNCETDLLEIVKKLRIFKFASDCILKPRQRNLVSFFNEYKLTDKSHKGPPPQESKSARLPSQSSGSKKSKVGLAGSAPENLEDVLEEVNKMFTALQTFDPDNDEKDNAIYIRIVPRRPSTAALSTD